MDMQINKEFLRQCREQRGWTQNHLAEVADLSLRTVQRIEATGVASNESAMALASALDLKLSDLMLQRDAQLPINHLRRWWHLAVVLTALLVSATWWTTASAEEVTINLSVKADSGSSGDMQMLNELGKQSEVKFDQQFRLLLTANKQDQHLLISAEIYDFINGDYQLVSTPSILVTDNQEAAIHLNTQGSGLLKLAFKSDF
jgi:transcriptional regulator with XRE-family HTH domain